MAIRHTKKQKFYAANAREHGAYPYALQIIDAADRTGCPYRIAFASVEQESDFHNIFGHDPGGAYPGQVVTKQKVLDLIRWRRWNGIGLTQLTYYSFVYLAQRMGGAHKVDVQLRVGFKILVDLRHAKGSWWGAFYSYNGSGPAATRYANMMIGRVARWHNILIGK